MDCPKCAGTLEKKTYGRKITVHRCSDCKGLWCKSEVLMERLASDTLTVL